MRKRSFLLLEVLIAFILVTVCLVPLVKQPLKHYNDEIKFLEEMEWERIADWTFTEIKELLLKNKIPWDEIPEKGKLSVSFPLPPKTVEIPGCNPKVVERSFKLKGKGEKEGLQNQTYRQLKILILLNKKEYTFTLPIQRIKDC